MPSFAAHEFLDKALSAGSTHDMTDDRIQERAYYLWEQRNRPDGDAQRDLFRAREIEAQLPFYLAYQSENSSDAAIQAIQDACPQLAAMDNPVVVLAVLDGSTESMTAVYERVYRASPGNGKKPSPQLVGHKESTFRSLWCECWNDGEQSVCLDQDAENQFPFRDTCLGLFSNDSHADAVVRAMASVMRMQHLLAEHNHSSGLAWDAQIHGRFSVADSVAVAVTNLKFCRRRDVILTPGLAETLSPSELRLARAAGVRSGIASAERKSDEATADLLSRYLGVDSVTTGTSRALAGC